MPIFVSQLSTMHHLKYAFFIFPVLLVSCTNERAGFDADFRECFGKYEYLDRITSEDFSETVNARIVNKPVPDWEFTDLNGKTVSLHSIQSPVVLVNFNIRRGEGHAFVGALSRFHEQGKELVVIVNCMNSEEDIRTFSPMPSIMPLALNQPFVHVIPGELEEDGEFLYVNGVNDDDAVCSIYYIGADHTIRHYDPYGALIDWRNSVLYENDSVETDYDAACDGFIGERIHRYLFKR